MNVTKVAMIGRLLLSLPIGLPLAPISGQASRPPLLSVSGVFARADKAVVLIRVFDERDSAVALGSGFIMPDGRVVTNAHVVEGASRVEVLSASGDLLLTARYAEAIHAGIDIAILARIASPPGILALAQTLPEIGDQIIVVGSPEGLSNTASDGIISGLRRIGGRRLLQITAPISHGSSGGPVLNRRGEVVGVSVSFLTEGQNLNFAVPVADLRALANSPPGKAEFGRRAGAVVANEHPAGDATYFMREAATYAAAGDYQKAADVLAQAAAKFPNNATILLNEASALSKAGNNPAALTAAQKAVQINPKIEGGYAQLALIYGAMNQPDQVMSTIRTAAANGSDMNTLAKVALAQGNAAYKAGNASKNRADLQRAIQFLQLSDQLEPSSDAKFLLGVSAFTVGQSAIVEAQSTKSCDLAHLADQSFATARDNIPAGLQNYPDAARQVLAAIPQYTPAVNEMVRRFCR